MMQGKEPPMRAEAPTRTRRSGFAPVCAKSWAVLCLAFNCLNPSPDDQPSNNDDLRDSIGTYYPDDPKMPTANDDMANGQGGGVDSAPSSSPPPDATPSQADRDAGPPLIDAGPDSGAAQ